MNKHNTNYEKYNIINNNVNDVMKDKILSLNVYVQN